MGFYKSLLMYRIHIAIGMFVLSAILAIAGVWDWFYLTIILAVVATVSQLLFGPMRLIQDAMEAEDVERATKLLDTVYFPRLLIKPVREGYYMLKSNIAMANKDFAGAEKLMKKSIKSKSKYTGTGDNGSSELQLGMIAMQKGNTREARKYLKAAVSKGLPDKDSKAAAYLQLSSIEIQARQIRVGREYFMKAKKLNPSTPELKSQIKQMEKYIHRAR